MIDGQREAGVRIQANGTDGYFQSRPDSEKPLLDPDCAHNWISEFREKVAAPQNL
jgi:hypothetical protein